MTEHYVTLFDATFLPNGLALHTSLQRHDPTSILWVLCMDQTTERTLSTLDLPGLRTLSLEAMETADLLSVKPTRSIAEYCWTLTPFTHDFVFQQDPSVDRVTYLDADLWFLQNPQKLFTFLESRHGHSLITEHAYSPEYAHNEVFGKYCVQFMPFTRDGSRDVRHWWQERVLEWCYARAEDGKFGDQKYLDDWVERFPNQVVSLANTEWTQGPWNTVTCDPADAVLYHFHRLRLVSEHRATVGSYRLPHSTVTQIYRPYLRDIALALRQLHSVGVPFTPQATMLHGWPLVKDYLDFKRHNWRSPLAPYSLMY